MAAKKSIEVVIKDREGRKRASVSPDSIHWSYNCGEMGSAVLAKLVINGVIPVTPVVVPSDRGDGYLIVDIDL